LLNFFHYSIVAHLAEHEIVGNMERDLIEQYKPRGSKISQKFTSFKMPDRPQGWIRRNNEYMSVGIYSAIGVLPFIAFIIWVFLK